jgi:S1-C subfamily serine protease
VREEWFLRDRESWSGPEASSWTSRRLIGAASVVAVSALAIGVGLGRLLTPVSATATVPTVVAGAVLEASDVTTAEGAAPETDIAEAASVARNGEFTPAPTESLVVVQVSVSACGSRSSGSGVLVADGLLLTAAHVVGDAKLVRIDYRGVTVTGEVLGVPVDGRDVALVALDAPLAMPVVGGVMPASGTALTVVGHPGGGVRSAFVGPIVDLAPVVASLAGDGDIVGVDVSIAEGISGGPAVDPSGAVVGLVVAKETATDTALVVALPDLAEIASVGLVPGECAAGA